MELMMEEEKKLQALCRKVAKAKKIIQIKLKFKMENKQELFYI